jgi:hypothetical protein
MSGDQVQTFRAKYKNAALRPRCGMAALINAADAYGYGAIAALAAGGGRMAYAGLAQAGSLLASSGAQASAFRSGLKTVFWASPDSPDGLVSP